MRLLSILKSSTTRTPATCSNSGTLAKSSSLDAATTTSPEGVGRAAIVPPVVITAIRGLLKVLPPLLKISPRSRHDRRASLALKGARDVLRVGDYRAFAAALEEADRGGDFRSHAALSEVSLGLVAPGIFQCQPVEPLLVGLAEVQGDLLDRGRDQEQVRPYHVGEQGGTVVLVDDGRHAPQTAAFLLDHGDAAAPGGYDDEPVFDKGPDDVGLHDADRGGRCNHPPPTPVGVQNDSPALPLLPLFGRRLIHERADRLARIPEGGVVAVHHGLGHDGRRSLVHVSRSELIVERLLEHVAGRPLSIGASVVQWDVMQFVAGEVGASEEETDLRAVAVGYDHLPTLPDHLRDVAHGLGGRLLLIG